MTQLETELDGPDFTQGVEISTVPDGTMLLGHVRGEAVLLVRRGVRLYLGISREMRLQRARCIRRRRFSIRNERAAGTIEAIAMTGSRSPSSVAQQVGQDL